MIVIESEWKTQVRASDLKQRLQNDVIRSHYSVINLSLSESAKKNRHILEMALLA